LSVSASDSAARSATEARRHGGGQEDGAVWTVITSEAQPSEESPLPSPRSLAPLGMTPCGAAGVSSARSAARSIPMLSPCLGLTRALYNRSFGLFWGLTPALDLSCALTPPCPLGIGDCGLPIEGQALSRACAIPNLQSAIRNRKALHNRTFSCFSGLKRARGCG
jgi:hypothetical protein